METLANYINIINGFAFKSNEMNKDKLGLPIVKIKELKNKGVLFTKETLYHKYSSEYHNFVIEYGDILIALTGNPVSKQNIDALVGRCSLYRHNFPALLNQRICKIVLKNNLLLKEYLFYYLSRDEITIALASSATGSANQANISSADILNLQLDIPSHEKQQHIVDIRRKLAC